MERKPFPSETQERFIVRFPDGMRDRIKEAADANNRSMNAEIVARIEGSFSGLEAAKESIPLVIKVLEDKLTQAAMDSLTYRRQTDTLAHLVMTLLKMQEAGNRPTKEENAKIWEIAERGCQGAEFHKQGFQPYLDTLLEVGTQADLAIQSVLESIETAFSAKKGV